MYVYKKNIAGTSCPKNNHIEWIKIKAHNLFFIIRNILPVVYILKYRIRLHVQQVLIKCMTFYYFAD